MSQEKDVFPWTKQEELSRSTSMGRKLLENSILAQKYSSKLMYLPYTKGQHSAGQTSQRKQLKKLYIDFLAWSALCSPSCPKHTTSDEVDHHCWQFWMCILVERLPNAGLWLPWASQSLPTAAWHTISVRLGCSWTPDLLDSIISSSLVTVSVMGQHSHKPISLIQVIEI